MIILDFWNENNLLKISTWGKEKFKNCNIRDNIEK